MKKIAMIVALLIVVGTVYFIQPQPLKASDSVVNVFGAYSAASAAVKTSSVIDVRRYPRKTMYVSGATIDSVLTAPTFGNMSGTAIMQCGPTSSGPWSTCVANDYAQTAVSLTSSGSITWTDSAPYVRFRWTAGTTGKKLKAWLYSTND